MRSIALLLGALGLLIGSVASAATFNFETVVASYNGSTASGPGAYTSLSQTNAGLTLLLTRESTGRFDVVQNQNLHVGKPASWGFQTLDPFFDTSNTAFIGNLSSAVSFVSLEAGDYGADDDTVTLEAYSGPNATGALLATNTVNYGGAAFPVFVTASVGFNGINSIRFIGGSSGFPNSVYYDNIVASVAVPVPGAAWAGLVLLIALAAGRMIRARAMRG